VTSYATDLVNEFVEGEGENEELPPKEGEVKEKKEGGGFLSSLIPETDGWGKEEPLDIDIELEEDVKGETQDSIKEEAQDSNKKVDKEIKEDIREEIHKEDTKEVQNTKNPFDAFTKHLNKQSKWSVMGFKFLLNRLDLKVSSHSLLG